MTRFGPTSGQVAAVRSWLTSAGLTVTTVNDKNLAGGYVAVRGPVAAASKAFGVAFGIYRGPDGRDDRAPSQPRPCQRRWPAWCSRFLAWTPPVT